MPIIETRRDDIRALEGVHLFHFATSNCSQRVRLALTEKGLDWESHHIDLSKCENATPDFLALNPKGVVPVLVHDGQTIIESNDIIQYIESVFEEPRLSPESESDHLYLEESLQQSSGFQAPLKVLSHEFLFKPVRRMNESQFNVYARGVKNPDLVDFMREFSSRQGFGREKVEAAAWEAERMLNVLEVRLASSEWLTCSHFGIADISWLVNVHRLDHMNYPMSSFQHVTHWLERLRRRPSFGPAITQFESRKMIAFFRVYSTIRRLKRTSVHYFIPERGECTPDRKKLKE